MILIVVFVICLIIGVPILATLGLATLVPMLVDGKPPLAMVAQTLYTGVDQFPLIAVTGFILAGSLMGSGGMTERIVSFSAVLVGRYTGGLAIVAIFACMFFAAITGSGPATVAAIGGLMIPGMVKRGYSQSFGGAVVASGGVLGILIPPSNPMIIYGVVGNVSITKLFMAGLLPGILIGTLMMAAAWLVARKRNYSGDSAPFSWCKLRAAANHGKYSLAAPIIILGGIYSGVFTPVEASAVAVFYALFVGVYLHREITIERFVRALRDTAIITGTVVVIVGVALAFGRLLTLYRIPALVAESLGQLTSDPMMLIFLIAIFLIILGTFMETLAQIVILTPVFMPIVLGLGIDPVHFGVIFVICCEIGFLTPPLGANLFVASKQAGVSIESISVSVLPFLAALMIGLILVIVFPQIALFLPGILL